MSVAEAWCVSTPSANLALAVPTSVNAGIDSIVHNAHRIYGPLMYPYLVMIVFFSTKYPHISSNLSNF